MILLAEGLASAGDSAEKNAKRLARWQVQHCKNCTRRLPEPKRLSKSLPDMPSSITWERTCCWVSTARGLGIAIKSQTKQETLMKMISAGAGLGVGVKDYRVIFVFENDKALSQFLNSGWSVSAQTDCRSQSWRQRRSFLGSSRSCPRRLGLSDNQEWSRPPVDAAGYEVLQGRRPQ